MTLSRWESLSPPATVLGTAAGMLPCGIPDAMGLGSAAGAVAVVALLILLAHCRRRTRWRTWMRDAGLDDGAVRALLPVLSRASRDPRRWLFSPSRVAATVRRASALVDPEHTLALLARLDAAMPHRPGRPDGLHVLDEVWLSDPDGAALGHGFVTSLADDGYDVALLERSGTLGAGRGIVVAVPGGAEARALVRGTPSDCGDVRLTSPAIAQGSTKRRYHRVPVALRAELHTGAEIVARVLNDDGEDCAPASSAGLGPSLHNARSLGAMVEDLGGGGARVAVDAPVELVPGAEVALDLTLRLDGRMRRLLVAARVARIEPRGPERVLRLRFRRPGLARARLIKRILRAAADGELAPRPADRQPALGD